MSNVQNNQGGPRRRSASRLAAVQALYEFEMSQAPLDSILIEFLQKRWDFEDNRPEDKLADPDKELFLKIVRGVAEHRDQITEMVSGALAEDWRIERLEKVLKNILMSGAFELHHLRDVPAKVIISEYVDVAKAFFSGGEPPMVNGVLDRLARLLREEEFN